LNMFKSSSSGSSLGMVNSSRSVVCSKPATVAEQQQ
jgi:hypothetical protein